MSLQVTQIGLIDCAGREVTGVLLEGDAADVKAVAEFFGEEVRLERVDPSVSHPHQQQPHERPE